MSEPTPEQPQAPTPLTEADYNIDVATLMQALGVDPGTVKEGTAKVEFLQGKAVLTYEVIRAVPARQLAVAMLAGTGMLAQTSEQQGPAELPSSEPGPIGDVPPGHPMNDDRPTRKGRRTAKKTTTTAAKKAVAKKTARPLKAVEESLE